MLIREIEFGLRPAELFGALCDQPYAFFLDSALVDTTIAQSQRDQGLERFLTGWAELRIVLEIAALNKLSIGLIVYHS